MENHLGSAMSTVSVEDNLVLSPSSEDSSSSYPDEPTLELGLGLSLGGSRPAPNPSPWGQYARILTARDFPSIIPHSSTPSSSSSSSSPSSVTKITPSSGTKRPADSVSSSPTAVSQVVGWPPVRACRMNSLVNVVKSSATEEFSHTVEKSKRKHSATGEFKLTNSVINKNIVNAGEKGLLNTSLFVKANMDGFPIGRKVDITAHSCYESLAQMLEEMFRGPTAAVRAKRSSIEEPSATVNASRTSRLLDGSSEFVLTYEDKEGDWMLVGDVPWGMFLSSVKRLRIMKTSEVNGLGAPKVSGQ